MAATKVFPNIGSSKLMHKASRITLVASKHAKYHLQLLRLVAALGGNRLFDLEPKFSTLSGWLFS